MNRSSASRRTFPDHAFRDWPRTRSNRLRSRNLQLYADSPRRVRKLAGSGLLQSCRLTPGPTPPSLDVTRSSLCRISDLFSDEQNEKNRTGSSAPVHWTRLTHGVLFWESTGRGLV